MARTSIITIVNTEALPVPTTPLPSRRRVMVQNLDGSDTLHLSYDSAVTPTTGHVVAAGAVLEFENSDVLYGISASGTISVLVMEME